MNREPLVVELGLRVRSMALDALRSGSQGVLLWKKDLHKTVRRTRSGILSLLLPMVLSAVLAVSFAGVQANDRDRLAALVLMNMWFVAVDYGVYPVRLLKRLRPIFLTYRISVLATLIAASIFAAINLAIRCGVIMLLMPTQEGLSLATAGLIAMVTGVLCIGCFCFGNLLASVSLSLHEVFIYAPHLFYGAGILSGFVQVPAVTTGIAHLHGNPLTVLAQTCHLLLADEVMGFPKGLEALLASGVIFVLSFAFLAWSRRLSRVVTLL